MDVLLLVKRPGRRENKSQFLLGFLLSVTVLEGRIRRRPVPHTVRKHEALAQRDRQFASLGKKRRRLPAIGSRSRRPAMHQQHIHIYTLQREKTGRWMKIRETRAFRPDAAAKGSSACLELITELWKCQLAESSAKLWQSWKAVRDAGESIEPRDQFEGSSRCSRSGGQIPGLS
jgi:hypothetical protein